jgi:hypothetical protein
MIGLMNYYTRIKVAKDNYDIVRHNKHLIPITYRIKTNHVYNYVKNSNKITLIDSGTNEATKYFSEQGLSVSLLNFANSYNVGGGYLKGCPTQEEELCRTCPFLYASLANSRTSSKFYPFYWNKTVLYTPNVTFIRDNKYNLLDQHSQYVANVITAAMPDFRQIDIPSNCTNELELLKYYEKYRYDIEHLIFTICKTPVMYNLNKCQPSAIQQNKLNHTGKTDVLILGAFGCGAFRPNVIDNLRHVYPEFVASCFKNVINCVNNYKEICFAIPDKNSTNYIAFNKILNFVA